MSKLELFGICVLIWVTWIGLASIFIVGGRQVKKLVKRVILAYIKYKKYNNQKHIKNTNLLQLEVYKKSKHKFDKVV